MNWGTDDSSLRVTNEQRDRVQSQDVRDEDMKEGED